MFVCFEERLGEDQTKQCKYIETKESGGIGLGQKINLGMKEKKIKSEKIMSRAPGLVVIGPLLLVTLTARSTHRKRPGEPLRRSALQTWPSVREPNLLGARLGVACFKVRGQCRRPFRRVCLRCLLQISLENVFEFLFLFWGFAPFPAISAL